MLRFRRGGVLISKNSRSEPHCLHCHWTRLERSRFDYPAHERIEARVRDHDRCATRNWAVANPRKASQFAFLWVESTSDMRLVVQKYGGTSVGKPERVQKVGRRPLETGCQGCRVVAVISPMAGV